jgi:hypothetical protein
MDVFKWEEVSSGCNESLEDALKKKSGVRVLDRSKSSFGVGVLMPYMVKWDWCHWANQIRNRRLRSDPLIRKLFVSDASLWDSSWAKPFKWPFRFQKCLLSSSFLDCRRSGRECYGLDCFWAIQRLADQKLHGGLDLEGWRGEVKRYQKNFL